MNLTAMIDGWKEERKGVPLASRSLSNVIRGYDQSDVDNMLKQVAEGMAVSKAAKANSIPLGSVSRLLPRAI